ncbi:Transposable element Tc3 transposase [Caligus rogercresseyi]|uniref:Transposable element Tc3 transposase n=1 Tax=Caligus rogercresseyi TaxID=217165 RepID=A0A7T8GXY8_CALRO|nr:Transposable element Tc3 transposase [Caligus rogercresseyi]
MLEEFFLPRIGPKGYLVSAGWNNGSHFKGIVGCFEGTFSGAPHFNKGDLKWPARSPDLSSCDFICGDICNPVLMSTAREAYQT